ncbi:hypothetical protein K2173_009626 [Erythroxylum novogranatense]|uniref:DYW domain-containing protein n=1 Tax=Erythroxylum novogranatense TaxID=1862640 RepID=A0AAV8U8C3_9ROSI|nr:hypothetical protein K2173_009626 [Erythroxylum novogranatense]
MKSLYALFKPTSPPVRITSAISSAKKPTSLANAPPETHFVSLIHNSKTSLQLHQIHAQVLHYNLSSSSLVTTQLISSSSLRKSIDYSLSIFYHFNPKNLFLFNALIRGLESNSRFEDAVSHFILMLRSSVRPDHLTFPFILKSVASLNFKELGGALHTMTLKSGLGSESFVLVSLTDMYVKVNKLGLAVKVVDESPHRLDSRGTILWNILINGYCKVGKVRKARELFDAVPQKETASWNSLINGLLKNGDMGQAKDVFDQMPDKDVVSWTTMVNGLLENGEHGKALSMFSRMLEEDVKPSDFTIVSALKACAKIGALEAGSSIHNYVLENGFRLTRGIQTALVDMYVKCGDVESASEVFKEVKGHDIHTWSAMIWGLAIHGHFEQAMQCFRQMMYAGVKPDEVVFLALLTACVHSGEVELGLNFFESMRLDYSIRPTVKHYTLIVELLGRAARLKEAIGFIENMPITPTFVIWGTFFCACRVHRNFDMEKLAAHKLLELETNHPESYIFLSNVYTAVGRWKDVKRVQELLQDRRVDKHPGWSCIEVEHNVHCFVAGDRTHKDAKRIYGKLEETMEDARKLGYVPGHEWAVHDIEVEEKEETLGIHSEKLALSFGLICSSPGTTIRIVKNIRICGDCHSFVKYASRITQTKIVLRAVKRFHYFKDGNCSCGDFW